MISNGELRRRRAFPRRPGMAGGMAIAASVTVLAGGMPVIAGAARAVSSGSGWSRPRVVPAPPVIGGTGFFTALSCASRSECTAVGSYQGERTRDFAVTERHGTWGKVLTITVPGAGKDPEFGGLPVLSCASAGNCVAGDWAGNTGFVISETRGTWGKARQVPGIPQAIACPAPGDCTAVLGDDLLNEEHGTWRKAFPVPGLAALRHGQPFDSEVISCPSPGNCAVAGSYYDFAVVDRSFVVTERHGTWGSARAVANRLSAGLSITALSCPSAGNCVATGYAYPQAGGYGGFAVPQTRGTWGAAQALPGTFKIGGVGGGIDQIDCPAAGACTALGDFAVGVPSQPYVSDEQHGTWHNAQTITGAGPGGGSGTFDSLSCAAAGTCVFAGSIPVRGQNQAATAEQVSGRWGPATVLPGIGAIDHGQDSEIEASSCPPRSRCTIVGSTGDGGPGYLFAAVQR